MIDPKELRVGAHVLFEGRRAEVTTISRDGLFNASVISTDKYGFNVNYLICGFSRLYPIPLTPELFTELGFEKKEEFGDVSAWTKDNMIVEIIGERKVISFVDKMHSLDVRFLHQLENFVYQINKEELIK